MSKYEITRSETEDILIKGIEERLDNSAGIVKVAVER